MPSEQEDRDAIETRFVAALGPNHPVTMVRGTMAATSRTCGLDNQFLALPNYVQVGSATGDGPYVVNPDVDQRYDQSFPLAQLVARPPRHTADGVAGVVRLLAAGARLARLHGRHTASRHPRTAVFTATLISMMSIAVGVQTGLLLRRAVIQPDRIPGPEGFS